jgi:cytochrome c-type biogenesis protein CcmH
MLSLLVAGIAAALLVLAISRDTSPAAAAVRTPQQIEQETRAIGRLLRCPVCQNLSVADSPSPLAGQMRQLIREQLADDRSRDAILAYFVARYGAQVLLDPPKSGFSQLLWWGAAAVPLGGLLLVMLRLRRWLRPGATESLPPALPAAERQRYEALLARELERIGERRP